MIQCSILDRFTHSFIPLRCSELILMSAFISETMYYISPVCNSIVVNQTYSCEAETSYVYTEPKNVARGLSQTVMFSGLLFTAFTSTCILGIICFVVGRVSPPPPLIPNSMCIKVPRCALLKISCIYALSGILVTLALDKNRVLCHLQDPIKGITLVFSLVYYFFFCRKSKFC